MKGKPPVSACCKAPLKMGGIGDFDDEDAVITQYFVCTKCDQPADIYAPNEKYEATDSPQQQDSQTNHELESKLVQTKTIDEILHKFAGCGYPHPDYMFCQWCSNLPEAKTALEALIVEAREDELLEIGLLAHKFEGRDYHCREIADAIDERLAALKNTRGGTEDE